MKSKYFYILIIFLLISGCNPEKDYAKPGIFKYEVPPVPEKYTFCGEEVPLYNFDVYERFERELIVNQYYHSLSLLVFKRSGRWFPVIEPILKKYGIPEDFKYLAVIESGLENVTSPKNAVGYWQFIKSAANRYGLEVNGEVDERYHVEKSTEAACKYLKEAYKKFGSWTMAAASYNAGLTGVQRQINRQKSNNYYNLILADETERYVFRIIATKYMFDNRKLFGFKLSEDDFYEPYQTKNTKVISGIKDWAEFAHSYGINYRTLKLLNPWLRDNKLRNRKRKLYEIKIPVEGSVNIIK